MPAAIPPGIGAQAQQPLARVIVGSMITTAFTILVGMPALEIFIDRRRNRSRLEEQGIS